MKTTIEMRALDAALHCAAVKDVRYYLNGVLLDFKHEANLDHINVVGTDGTILCAYRLPLDYLEGEQVADFQLIIPIDSVKAAIKTKAKFLELSSLDDGRYMLGDIVFTPIDEKFPDYSRVIPRHDQVVSIPDYRVIFNPDLLVRCTKSLRAWYSDKNLVPNVHYSTTYGSAVMHCGESSAVCVVMPTRVAEISYQGFNF